jgi:hypothetical protein
MVHSSALTIATDGEYFTCDGFSFGETVRLGSFEFIANYFSGLSLSPRRRISGAAVMGSTYSGSPSPRWAVIEDSTEELHTVSHEEGGSSLPTPRRCGTGAPPTSVTSTPWMENAPVTQAMTTVPLRLAVQW